MNKTVFQQIVKSILESNSIMIFPHVIPDGDTIGCASALKRAFTKIGKKAQVIDEKDIPDYLKFLTQDYEDWEEFQQDQPDLCIAVDCSDLGRLGERKDFFLTGKRTVNIDHHPTNTCFADLNYIDDKASATGEIIFDLLKGLNIQFDPFIAEAIYSAISTDTGSFKYTNTSTKSHLVAAELIDMGVDLNEVSVELYQNTRLEKIRLEAEVLETLEIICDGKVASAYATEDMLKKTGATMNETEGFIELLRNIQGVEVAIFFKETQTKEIKIGFRAKQYADVSKIAMKFGGGGHVKAAGCTINDSLDQAKKLTYQATEEMFRKLQE